MPDRKAWRGWLTREYDCQKEIWLVFHKRNTGIASIPYKEAVEEAICFGWIDSIVRRIDDDRYVRKFTPRRSNSRWSTVNRRRYEKMKALGLLARPGLLRAPTDLDGDAPRRPLSYFPDYIREALKADNEAWKNFMRLAPSYRRAYIGWIDSAKREQTRKKRLAEAVTLVAAGHKLGLR